MEMKKALGFWDSIAVITAIVVGVGIFRVPAEVASYLKGPYLILSVWLLGGVISLAGALCYAELSSSFPGSGGTYIYLKESYGPLAGFLFGWAELLVIRTGSIAAVAFLSAEYLCSLISVGSYLIKPIAIFIIFAFTMLNLSGLGRSKRAHNIFTAVNIAALAGMIAFSFLSGKGTLHNFGHPHFSLDLKTLPAVGLALIPILWAYGGWHENTFVAEETKDATKTIPRALFAGVGMIILLYLAANISYLYVFSAPEIAQRRLIGADMFETLYGDHGRRIFESIVLISSLGCINAMVLTGSRVTFALGRDNPAFRWLGRISDQSGVPVRAIFANAVWASAMIVFGSFGKLLFFTGIVVWLFFAMAASGVFILRRRYPDMKRPYKVWGYPFTPLVFVIICGALFANTLFFNPLPSFLGLSLLAAGLPVYFMSASMKKEGAL